MKAKLYVYHKLVVGDHIDLDVIRDIRSWWGEKIVEKLLNFRHTITGLKCCTLSYGEENIDYPIALYERNGRWYKLDTDKLWKKKLEEIGPY